MADLRHVAAGDARYHLSVSPGRWPGVLSLSLIHIYNTHFTDKDLGGYFNWNDRSLPISTAGIRHGSVWRGSVALGDYLHNDAVMATFVYDPELSDGDTVAHDLDALALPATTMGQLFLPATGRFGSSIVWTSSNPAVVDPATGEVKNPAAGEPAVVVTLTAKVTFGSAEAVSYTHL